MHKYRIHFNSHFAENPMRSIEVDSYYYALKDFAASIFKGEQVIDLDEHTVLGPGSIRSIELVRAHTSCPPPVPCPPNCHLGGIVHRHDRSESDQDDNYPGF